MSDPVLDTIDHVLHDWDTSADAMRWTPEPIADHPVQLAPNEVVATAAHIARVMRDAQEKLARAFTNMATQVIKLQVQYRRLMAGQLEAEAQIRRSAMHSEYHRRRRNRR